MPDPVRKIGPKEIRDHLGGTTNEMSDRAVLEFALQQPDDVISPSTKELLSRTYGESPLTSFAKGLGRGLDLDMIGEVIDYTNPVGWLTDKKPEEYEINLPEKLAAAPIQTGANTAANIFGRVGGNIASMAIPASKLVKLGGVGRAGLAALSGGSAISQNYGDQVQEMVHGDRKDISEFGLGMSAIPSAVGGALLPSVLKAQAASTGAPLVRGLKYALKGGLAGGTEGAFDAGANRFSYTDNSLNPSGVENRPSTLASIIQGGLIGSLLGGSIDFLDGTTAARHMPGTGVGAPPSPAAGAPVTPRAGASPSPVLQTTGYDPAQGAYLPFRQTLNQFESPQMDEAITNAVVHGGLGQARELTGKAAAELTSKPPKQILVNRTTGEQVPIWFSSTQGAYYGLRGGKVVRVPKEMFKEGQNVIRVIQKEPFMYPGEHKMVPAAAQLALAHGTDTIRPISFSPDMNEVGVVKFPLAKGELHPVEIMRLDDSLQHQNAPWKEALQRALADRKIGNMSKMMKPEMEEIPSTDALLDSLGAGLSTDLQALQNQIRNRKRP